MSFNKYEICFKSIINALSQLDKLNIGSYEQRIEVIVTLLEKFNLIQSTEKLESQNKKLVERLKEAIQILKEGCQVYDQHVPSGSSSFRSDAQWFIDTTKAVLKEVYEKNSSNNW